MNEMMARTLSMGVSGVNGFPVDVEVFGVNGIPGMEIIGLPDASIRESRDRVIAAIINSGIQMIPKRITVNLAPADQKKEGPSFDLPIAVGVLLSTGQLIPDHSFSADQTVILGELSLNGKIRPVHGALPMVISAKENGIHDIILPLENAREVACIEGIRVFPASTLLQVIHHIDGSEPLEQQQQISFDELRHENCIPVDMSLIRGQHAARRALEVAAAGGHNMLLRPPSQRIRGISDWWRA